MLFWLLVVVGVLLIVAGLAGCVLPVLPGPPLSALGLLAIWGGRGFDAHTFGWITFAVLAFAAAAVTALDFVVPAWGAKRYGASRAGVWGSVAGMLVGMIWFPPFGMLIGAFAGALVGEVLAGREGAAATKAAWGVFVGTMFGIVLKLACSGVITWYFFAELFSTKGA